MCGAFCALLQTYSCVCFCYTFLDRMIIHNSKIPRAFKAVTKRATSPALIASFTSCIADALGEEVRVYYEQENNSNAKKSRIWIKKQNKRNKQHHTVDIIKLLEKPCNKEQRVTITLISWQKKTRFLASDRCWPDSWLHHQQNTSNRQKVRRRKSATFLGPTVKTFSPLSAWGEGAGGGE